MDKVRVIDLFAGIGGIRLGFEQAAEENSLGCKCVFASEIDDFACKTYRNNFPGDNHDPKNDITKIDASTDIPDYDILLGGFPCQAFSIAGARGGFEDTRGTLFFDIARIVKETMPKAFLLENVKGLVNHRSGKTLATIINVLKNDLGYASTTYNVLNSKNFGVAQNRERVYIVGFRDCGGGFEFPKATNNQVRIKDIIEEKPVSPRYYLSECYWKSLQEHRKRHEKKGNGFGYEIRDMEDIANAIIIGGMGKERNLLVDNRQKDLTPVTNIKGEVNKEGIRRMTPIEWERLQNFPDDYTSCVSNAQRYKQLGNSVTVSVVRAVVKNILGELANPQEYMED